MQYWLNFGTKFSVQELSVTPFISPVGSFTRIHDYGNGYLLKMFYFVYKKNVVFVRRF